MRPEVRAMQAAMEREGYIAEPAIATAVFLARTMRKPLLIEGDAGVGKTEIAKVLARILETELIRLQCYEGIDVNTALYEWNYQRQMLRLRIVGTEGREAAQTEQMIFSRDCLLERPLLRAITRRDAPPVLLIDEIDRADDGFEAFLLEILSDFQVTIPELGAITAKHVPYAVLTSNRTREIGDALRRRCFYLYVEHPSLEKEVRIIRSRVPGVMDGLAQEIAAVMQAFRGRRLHKAPGVAETLDWTRALMALRHERLDVAAVEQTLGCILKDQHDVQDLTAQDVESLLADARSPSGSDG